MTETTLSAETDQFFAEIIVQQLGADLSAILASADDEAKIPVYIQLLGQVKIPADAANYDELTDRVKLVRQDLSPPAE